MTDLEQACSDLPPWQPVLAGLIAEPDRSGTAPTRTKPGSRAPWNGQVADASTGIHAAVRSTEQTLRYAVTGTLLVRGGSDENTLKAIGAIIAMSAAVDAQLADDAARTLTHLLSAVLQLPAIDLDQPPAKPEAPCPRCGRKMLRFHVLKRELACLGCTQKAQLLTGPVSGQPMLKWDDGEITIPAEGAP